jgi:hypothetical protein
MKQWLAVVVLVAAPALAHAECGWLLMVPPVLDKRTLNAIGTRAAINAPVSEWDQEEAFDSAEKCEEARRRLIASRHFDPVDSLSRCLPASLVPVK